MEPTVLRGGVRVEMPQRCGRDEMRSKLVPLFSASWKLAVRMIELTDGRCQVSAGRLREERETFIFFPWLQVQLRDQGPTWPAAYEFVRRVYDKQGHYLEDPFQV